MSEFVQSLARGIAVVRSFSADAPRQTLSDVARSTGLTRATARRLLLTLEDLGYVRSNGRYFELTARILDIGYSYVASLNLNDIAQPFLESFSEVVRESSSVSVLDDTDIVYIARVPTKRIMTVAIGLGSRFPAFQTSMGRVLLAEQDDDEVLELFRRSDRSQTTEYTVTSGKALLEQLHKVRQLGWSLVDQELEIGVRSLAAPLRDAAGTAIAAMNVSTHVGRTSLDELTAEFLPRLLDTAASISRAISMR
ncbi:MAG: helix-turn-helix domain-containing protein [bacterium]|nr:helix-turn-helix domain-containing protein [bacterium]MCY3633200.1 helix-turn-helix domain-containing protein [bacterium]